MKTILCEKIQRITTLKKKLQERLNVKITNKGNEVFINGNPEDEYFAEKVIDALNFGFSFSSAILIKEGDCIFEILNIKDHTRRNDLERIRARIIGTNGKTLKTLSDLTESHFELKDNFVGIISIIRGAKQKNVYNFLEKRKVEDIEDLGLKKPKKKTKEEN